MVDYQKIIENAVTNSKGYYTPSIHATNYALLQINLGLMDMKTNPSQQLTRDMANLTSLDLSELAKIANHSGLVSFLESCVGKFRPSRDYTFHEEI